MKELLELLFVTGACVYVLMWSGIVVWALYDYIKKTSRMAVFVKYKEDVYIGERKIGSITFTYWPLLDGNLEPYTKNDEFEVTESEPGEIKRIIEEQKGITCQQLNQTH